MTDESPFASAESYYARYRPGYGDAAVDHLRERFSLDAEARALDLGCGAGQLAIPLAEYVGEVVAMDPNEAMLRETRTVAAEAGRENLSFVHGGDADLHDEMGPFRLTTMGRSFHWMDQRSTLASLRSITEPAGGVALVTGEEWLTKGQQPWQAAVYDITARYLDALPDRVDPATIEYDDPWDELLAENGFRGVETATFPVDREWSVDEVIGYVFSLSYASPARFGEEKEAFDAALRARLADLGDGPFEQTATVEVISGFVGEA